VRKRYTLGALFGALVVVLAGAALALGKQGAGPNHHFDFTFKKPTAGATTGISKIFTDRFNYKAPAAGQPADPVTKIVFTTPKGTKVDTSVLASSKVLKACTKAKLGSSGDPKAAKCPKLSSKRGSAVAITGIAAVDPVLENVDLYGANKQFVIRLTPKGAIGQTANIFITISGRKLVAVVPPFCLPGDNASTPGCDKGEAVLKTLTINAKSVKKGKKPFIKYGSCKRNGATNKTTAVYSFRNTPTEKVTSTQKCKT
jgi:hypothetical protein